jgi:hypothetical protein
MIYQNPYQNIRTANIYGARKQAGEDQLAAQENQLALQQKQNAFQKAKIVDTYKALNTFAGKSEESKAAQWPTIRAQIVSLSPEMEQGLPKDWMSDPVGNQSQLQAALEGMSSFITPERITLRTDEVIQERLPGGQFKEIASGPKKPKEFLKMVEIRVGDTTYRIPEGNLPSGSILSGQFVQDARQPGAPAIPVKEYFAMYPNDWPKNAEVISGNSQTAATQPSVNSLSKPPAAPMAVPGQTELPPRNFNAPSPTNRAGETNVGFPIDENAMMQQQQIMPSMGNMMLRGAGAVMADEFAPQPRNALVGGMMPQPSQFAELMPAGSAPNRFGSPGVEGIDFAATGGRPKVEIVNGVATYTAAPKPGQERVTARDMTAQEIRDNGRDPREFSGQILSDGTKKFDPIPLEGYSKTQLDKMLQELENLRTNAKTEAQKADVSRKEKLFVLRNLKEYEYALQKLENNPMVDTGPLDQFVSALTPAGQQIVELGTRIEPIVRKVQRTPGDPAAASETASFGEMLPKLNKFMTNNVDNLNAITRHYLDLYGANAMVNSKSEYDALYSPDQDIIYIDLRDGKRYVKPKGKK